MAVKEKIVSLCKCGAVPKMTLILLCCDYNAEGDLVFYSVYCPACGEGHNCSKDRENYNHEIGSYYKPEAIRYWNNTIAGRSRFDNKELLALATCKCGQEPTSSNGCPWCDTRKGGCGQWDRGIDAKKAGANPNTEDKNQIEKNITIWNKLQNVTIATAGKEKRSRTKPPSTVDKKSPPAVEAKPEKSSRADVGQISVRRRILGIIR